MNDKSIKINQGESLSQLINLVIKSGINIDLISRSILSDFKRKTLKSTKDFYKISKKNNKKKTISFVRKEIRPLWIGIVEASDPSVIDLRINLEEEKFLHYIAGLYISIHSKNIEENGNVGLLVKSTLAEMYQHVAFKLNEGQ